jgi:hypothetical protein
MALPKDEIHNSPSVSFLISFVFWSLITFLWISGISKSRSLDREDIFDLFLANLKNISSLWRYPNSKNSL